MFRTNRVRVHGGWVDLSKCEMLWGKAGMYSTPFVGRARVLRWHAGIGLFRTPQGNYVEKYPVRSGLVWAPDYRGLTRQQAYVYLAAHAPRRAAIYFPDEHAVGYER